MVNRDRHDIVLDILEKANPGKRKTELMSEVGLSYVQSKQYLSVLLKEGLLKIDTNNCYKTTNKGLEFLEKCSKCFLWHWPDQKKK